MGRDNNQSNGQEISHHENQTFEERGRGGFGHRRTASGSG